MKSKKEIKTIIKKNGLLEFKLKDKLFILNENKNKIYQFNSTATFIWTIIKKQTFFKGLNRRIKNSFKGEELTEKELINFLVRLEKLNLVSIKR
jgi:hypothetical protein